MTTPYIVANTRPPATTMGHPRLLYPSDNSDSAGSEDEGSQDEADLPRLTDDDDEEGDLPSLGEPDDEGEEEDMPGLAVSIGIRLSWGA